MDSDGESNGICGVSVMRTEHLEVAMKSLGRLRSLLELIRNEQEYYRARVHRHVQSTLQGNGFCAGC